MRRAWWRLRAMLRGWTDRGARDEDLSEELLAFVEHDADAKVRSGMTPEEARRAALIELGGAEHVKEEVRDSRTGAYWEGVFRDIRYAVRSLAHARGFAGSVIGSLSLGLSATIVAFAFINGALVRPFPGVREQGQLVTLEILESTAFAPRVPPTALTDYPEIVRTLREGMTSLDGLASFTESDVAVSLPEPRSLQAVFVSPNYFAVLGVQPAMGRTFAPEEGAAASAGVIIGYDLWAGAFRRDPSVVGRAIRAGGQIVQIIGVAPSGFRGTMQNPIQTGVELWLPIALADRVGRDDPESSGLKAGERVIRYIGRMRDGVDEKRVETELGVVAGRVIPSLHMRGRPGGVEVAGLSRLDRADAAQLIAAILPVPVLVLVIACVNAANLFLIRGSRRGREMALRLAVGASRVRLVRQLVIESLILAIGAALLALPLAWAGLQLLAAFSIPMPLDPLVVAGALVIAFLTALGCGLVPALTATRQQPSAALGTAPEGSGGTRAQSRGRRVLVAVQVALSLGLLATGFQLTSALDSLAQPPGTDPDHLLLASFDVAQLRFSPAERDTFYAVLLDRVAAVPGVRAAGLSSRNLARSWERDPVNAVVLRAGIGTERPSLWVSASAGGAYFEALGLDIVQGRAFVASDRRDMPAVAIVSERLAAQLFGGKALGRSLHVSTFADAPAADILIVGIVKSPVEHSGEDVAAIFFPSPFPSSIQRGTALTLHVRSDGPAAALAPALRTIVAELDPRVPILELATLHQKIRADSALPRALADVAALLGIVALLLASVGLYGVTSYSVAMRGREIAVRMALGARADSVVVMVVRQALAVATIGAALGGVVAVVAGLLIRAEVVGVAGIDVARLSGSVALLASAMLLASLLPAWRAARLDPSAVLREA